MSTFFCSWVDWSNLISHGDLPSQYSPCWIALIAVNIIRCPPVEIIHSDLLGNRHNLKINSNPTNVSYSSVRRSQICMTIMSQTQGLAQNNEDWSAQTTPHYHLKSRILDQYLKNLGFYGNSYFLLRFTTTGSSCINLWMNPDSGC